MSSFKIHVQSDLYDDVFAQSRSVEEALVDSGLEKFNELLQLAKEDLGEDYFSNKTVFAPSDRALRDMPKEVIEGYKTDKSGLKGWADST